MDLLRYNYCTSTGTCYNCTCTNLILVNFVIANSIQGTIISIIALTCFFNFFISCHAVETGLLTRLFAVHTHKWQPPSRAVHVAAKI